VHISLPHHCALCGASTSNRLLCTDCDADLPHYRAPACPICALPTASGQVCGACLQRHPAFDRTLAAFSYHFPVDRLLHAFKYSGDLALADVLAKPLAQRAADHPKPDLLIPMPLHPGRLRERGFNQSLEIAKLISRWLDIPLAADACRRTRDTPPQAGLKWKERRRNVRGAFACDLDLSGGKIAILDDVITTGATLNEICRILKARGASEVSAWVVARTPHQ
jgi:ComF family protein